MNEFHFYQDTIQSWRWRLLDGNRHIVADSAEGYQQIAACRHGASLFQQHGPAAPEHQTTVSDNQIQGYRWEYFSDKAGGWRWHFQASNRVVADSAESYRSKHHVERAIASVRKLLQVTEEAEETDRDVRLLHSIRLQNILSFGPDTPTLELRALNVLIGPNGSGKSNLLACLGLLPAVPNEFGKAFETNDNQLSDWFWRQQFARTATIQTVVGLPDSNVSVRHELNFRADTAGRLQLIREAVYEGDEAMPPTAQTTPYLADLTTRPPTVEFYGQERSGFGVSGYLSILQQLRDPLNYPAFRQLTTAYQGIFFFWHWTFGSESLVRKSRPLTHISEFLTDGGDNLARILHWQQGEPIWKATFIAALNELYEGITDYETRVLNGRIELVLREGSTSIPASRLSDGTLRYLCLLAILLHPVPPPLICIEEPELGLHPDVIVAVGKLIKAASTRTQLVVTTHSTVLLDTLSATPEDVVVCYKAEGGTVFKRLEAGRLQEYLEEYSLGTLWSSGDIGGNRW